MKVWLRRKLARWLWRDDPWTKAVDEIESAVKKLRNGQVKDVTLHWHFSYMEPPGNRFHVTIELDD